MKATRGTTVVRSCRRGMTLVELLIVTGLIAVLLGLTVVGVSAVRRPSRSADDLTAMLISAQSRSLNVPEGAAVVLSAPIADLQGSGSSASTSAFDAEMLPFIQATGSFVVQSSTAATVSLMPLTGDDARRAYKILLGGQGNPVTSPATESFSFAAVSGTSGVVRFRAIHGQTQYNTVWPKVPGGGGVFTAMLAQCPVKSSSLAEFDPDVAVDLRFSGIGDDAAGQFNTGPQGPIALIFDQTGRVAEVIKPLPEPDATATTVQFFVSFGSIYFLVASREDIQNGVNTLESDESTWVAVASQSGRVIQAENVPVSGTTSDDLWNARAKARAAVGAVK